MAWRSSQASFRGEVGRARQKLRSFSVGSAAGAGARAGKGDGAGAG